MSYNGLSRLIRKSNFPPKGAGLDWTRAGPSSYTVRLQENGLDAQLKVMRVFEGHYAAFCKGRSGVGSSCEEAIRDLTNQITEK